jgi:hypothetical protein
MVAFIPGIVHAWYVIAKYPDTDGYERVPVDVEAGRGSSTVTYVIVPAPHGHHQQHLQQQQPKSGQAMNYGTTSNHAGSSSSAPPHRDNEDSGNSDNNNAHAPPTYAEAVKGDHKVQSDE